MITPDFFSKQVTELVEVCKLLIEAKNTFEVGHYSFTYVARLYTVDLRDDDLDLTTQALLQKMKSYCDIAVVKTGDGSINYVLLWNVCEERLIVYTASSTVAENIINCNDFQFQYERLQYIKQLLHEPHGKEQFPLIAPMSDTYGLHYTNTNHDRVLLFNNLWIAVNELKTCRI